MTVEDRPLSAGRAAGAIAVLLWVLPGFLVSGCGAGQLQRFGWHLRIDTTQYQSLKERRRVDGDRLQ
jgi:hypothetical protein